MTDATFLPAAAPLRELVRDSDPILRAVTLLLVAMAIPTLAAMALDPRTLEGVSIWLKPLKFEIALVLYVGTLAVFARWLPDGMRRARWFRAYLLVVAMAIMAEMAWIGGAAAFGTTSHFNVASPAMATIYGLMGAAAVTLTSASLVMGVGVWRNPATGLSAPVKLSVALGLVLTFALTVPVAGYMSSQPGHFVGVPLTGAAVPFMGWSREVGDLRVAHFLATHALHILPLAGLAALALPEALRLRAVWAAAGLFALMVAALFAQAVAGAPVWPLG